MILDKDAWLNKCLALYEQKMNHKVTKGGFSTLITCYYAGWDEDKAVQLLRDARYNKRGGFRLNGLNQTLTQAEDRLTIAEASATVRTILDRPAPIRAEAPRPSEEVANGKATGVRESVWSEIAKSRGTSYTAAPIEQPKEEGRRKKAKGRRADDDDSGSGRAGNRRSRRSLDDSDDTWDL